jgi:lysozyme
MSIAPEGLALIRRFESLSLQAYLCPAGKWTIGYGHTGLDVGRGKSITPEEAEALLYADAARFAAFVRLKCPTATALQHAAMACLCFNIGTGNFQKSSVRRLHNAGDTAGAARAFALWTKATGADGKKRELRGLVRRRASEAALYLSDDGRNDPQRTRAADVSPEKPLTASRVMIGSSLGGAGTLSAGFTQLAEQLEWAKDLIAPMTPYLPWVHTAFIGLGVAGIAMAMIARWTDRKHGRL